MKCGGTTMIIFGYGSLMWDGWEESHDCVRKEVAYLDGFERDFNKASTVNWGSSEHPAPTLGLARSTKASCAGLAFEFEPRQRESILKYLTSREGKAFSLVEHDVRLASGATVRAYVAVNDITHKAYIGGLSLAARAEMACHAAGRDGSGREYVNGIHEKLAKLQIRDDAVTQFVNAVNVIE
jgi:cation transport protein ChaC